MNALTYTSIHQMTYLFIETALGNIQNETVNDSLQAFLHDANESIANQETESAIIRETLIDYVTESDFSRIQVTRLFKELVDCTERILNDIPFTTVFFYDDIKREIEKEMKVND